MSRSNCKFVRENWMHEFGQPHWPVKSTPTQLLNRTHDLGEPLVCDIEAAFTPAFFLHPPHCLSSFGFPFPSPQKPATPGNGTGWRARECALDLLCSMLDLFDLFSIVLFMFGPFEPGTVNTVGILWYSRRGRLIVFSPISATWPKMRPSWAWANAP